MSKTDLMNHQATTVKGHGVDRSKPEWVAHTRAQLEAIRGLEAGWDSHGAPPPERLVVDAAESLLGRLVGRGVTSRPHVNPTPSGGVQFEWESGSRYFEVELTSDRSLSWFYQDEELGLEENGTLELDEHEDCLVEYIRKVASAC